MATFYGDNHTAARINEPSSKVHVSDQGGRVRRMADSITLASELALSDIIVAGVLPANARVVDARLIFPTADGVGGQLEFGWASNGTDSADANGLFAAAEGDFGSAAVDAKMLGSAAGKDKLFAPVETTLQFTCAEATTASTGNLLKWEVFYIVD